MQTELPGSRIPNCTSAQTLQLLRLAVGSKSIQSTGMTPSVPLNVAVPARAHKTLLSECLYRHQWSFYQCSALCIIRCTLFAFSAQASSSLCISSKTCCAQPCPDLPLSVVSCRHAPLHADTIDQCVLSLGGNSN